MGPGETGHSSDFWVLFHSFQPSFFSKTSSFPLDSTGFLNRMIPGKNGEVSPRTPRLERHSDLKGDLVDLGLAISACMIWLLSWG